MSGLPIVFGVDFSPIMRRAIPWVRECIARGQPAVLVHAIDTPPLPGFLGQVVPRQIAAEHLAGEVLARLQSLAERAAVPDAERIARAGRADEVLRDVAREQSAQLLVIGAHGIPSPPWRRVGTTAERLLRAAEQTLLVVNGPMIDAPKRILVAVDDVDITPCVIAHAGAIADAHAAELHAIHVLSPSAYNHMLSAEAAEGVDEIDARRRVKADLANEALRWVRALWANTHRHSALHAQVPHGIPADEILRVAREQSIDLIVIGRYGLGRVIPAVLGSVVGSVVAGADCPVLVVS
jgi:nucleotide-binding universal stress UspA family protein